MTAPVEVPSPPRWLDELVLEPGPPWLSMGTRAIGAAGWQIVDEDFDAFIEEKRRLLRVARDAVVIERDAYPAAGEAAELIKGHDELDKAALEVQEDLAVLVRHDDGWHLEAGVICFPSHWDPRAKLGKHITEVHGPVPHYRDELAAKVDRFLDRLAPDRPAWRRIWMLHASPALHVPHPPPPDEVARARVPDDVWLRSERQVLAALPATGAILFTIRTQQVPLGVLLERPDIAARMAATIRAWQPALASYRGGAPFLARVCAWLDQAVAMKR
jgi:Protein of unknown function (DUF3445)